MTVNKRKKKQGKRPPQSRPFFNDFKVSYTDSLKDRTLRLTLLLSGI